MALPKTNLFKGDRVKLTPRYINRFALSCSNTNRGVIDRAKRRIGTIVSDTLNPYAEHIRVRWDGNKVSNRQDQYMPDDLTLYEEEDALV